MTVKRIVAVGCIFALACAGWWILGTATVMRSTDFFKRLSSAVETLWGTPLVQEAPTFGVTLPGREQVRWLMASKNDIKVDLKLDYRKKGLMWYPTYTCAFDGTYTIANTEPVAQKVKIHFNFPAKGGTFDGFAMTLDGKDIQVPVDTREGAGEIVELAPGASREFRVTYRTRGLREWRYQHDRNTGRVKNLALTVKTDFAKVDFPDGTSSPSSLEIGRKDAVLSWKATDQITREDIGITIPEKLNPGPVTSRITFFAPVCLIFFFILTATINIMYRVSIHPMHYLFVAAGFFAFHLLLSYLVAFIDIHLAFGVSAVVSVFLVTSYLSAALGKAFPWKVAAAGQVFFLVLFSYSFFLQGMTGLTVAIGSVVTLGILMKMTAHVDWAEVFAKKPRIGIAPATGAVPPPVPQ